ncbi:hypothetical protein VTN77DRAFT_3471 [Rasamsonia byssochlamydoides]|uniref:uncharacterized protein n=1 Tax=Rasamsonia byssochlamydoides TaxID=89139 RepID=UPI003742C90A
MEHFGDEETGPNGSLPVEQQPHSPVALSPSKEQPQLDQHNHHDIAANVPSGDRVSNGTVRPASSVPDGHGMKEHPTLGVVPPYWRHHREPSRASQTSLDICPAITLEDHTEDPNSDTSRGLWAKSVTIDDHVVVQGMTGVGAYVVWICKIEMLEGGPMIIRMRYSEFDELRNLLLAAFPHAKSALPPLPPKSVLFKFRPSFLESRRVGLQYFLNCVLLNPEFSGSPVLKDFLFSHLG